MYVAIEGVIGVGKTTLARLLRPMFEAEILLEIFEEIPFSPISIPTVNATPFRPKSSSF